MKPDELQPDSPSPNLVVDVDLVRRAGDLDHRHRNIEMVMHVFLLLVCAAIIVMSFLIRVEGEYFVFLPGSNHPLPETCYSKYLFGVDCPGCGLTRSFVSISNGDFARAAHFNWAGWVTYLFVVAQIPWRAWQIFRLLTRGESTYSPLLFVFPGIVFLALIVNWIGKLF